MRKLWFFSLRGVKLIPIAWTLAYVPFKNIKWRIPFYSVKDISFIYETSFCLRAIFFPALETNFNIILQSFIIIIINIRYNQLVVPTLIIWFWINPISCTLSYHLYIIYSLQKECPSQKKDCKRNPIKL